MLEIKRKLDSLETEMAHLSVEIEIIRRTRPTARERLIELQEKLKALMRVHHELKYHG